MASEHPFLHQARRDLERAEAAKKKAELVLRAAEADIYRLRNFIDQYEIYMNDSEREHSANRARARSRNITDIAVSIVESSENPLTVQAIIAKMAEMNIEVGGENKAANLAAYLSKDNRVRYERGLGWMLSADALFPEEVSDIKERSRIEPSSFQKREGAPFDAERLLRQRQKAGLSEVDDDIPF